MTKNPIVNALVAALYIGIVSTIMYVGSNLTHPVNSVLDPIVILSLFTLSAAVMSYVFFYQPVLMYLEGQKVEGVKLGLQTIGTFAVITAILLATLFISPLFY